MRRVFCFALILYVIVGCEELIEVEDISNKTVSILAPIDNTIIDDTTVNFSWQALEYAESYHLQIAQPSFNTAQIIVEDTIVSITSFTKVLNASGYQWRIKAINSAYETQYTTNNLTIED